LIDFAARSDIDALGRLVDQQHLGFTREFAPDQRLLLVAAGEVRSQRIVVFGDHSGNHAEPSDDLLAQHYVPPFINDTAG